MDSRQNYGTWKQRQNDRLGWRLKRYMGTWRRYLRSRRGSRNARNGARMREKDATTPRQQATGTTDTWPSASEKWLREVLVVERVPAVSNKEPQISLSPRFTAPRLDRWCGRISAQGGQGGQRDLATKATASQLETIQPAARNVKCKRRLQRTQKKILAEQVNACTCV